MRFWVYDEDNKLFRKFHDQAEAQKFLQPGWKMIVKPMERKPKPTPETHGEALI